MRLEQKKSKKRKGAASIENGDEKKTKVEGVDPVNVEDTDVLMKQEDSDDHSEQPIENGISSSHAEGAVDAAGAVADDEEQQEEQEEEVIDPRIHYRPMVAELQASVIELNQLINTIDLIRRREFLEDMQCIRENTAEKKEDLEYLIESKAQQLKDLSRILLAGVDALTLTVEKESNFFTGVDDMIRKWKICAPIHGNIPKPFRAGEPLAVDCSFVSAGSTFVPPTRSIADLSFAELSRTDKGLVCVKAPEDYVARTIQVELHSVKTGARGVYRLPPQKTSTMTRAALNRLENNEQDLKILEERNTAVLKAVQFSVFCEELFYSVMQEALWSSGSWTDAALSSKKPAAKKPQRNDDFSSRAPGSTTVQEILDDEIRLRLRDQYDMVIRLIDIRIEHSTSKDSKNVANGHTNGHVHQQNPDDEEDFLRETCRFALLLLQQEIRQRHGRSELSRGMLFTSGDGTSPAGVILGSQQQPQPEVDKDARGGVLATVVKTISHNLLKNEVAMYVDDMSAKLAWQSMQVSSSGRVLEDGLNQPICDSVRGVYVSPRWKTCPYDSTLAALDLNIGKNFSTEILISGTLIRFEEGPGIVREITTLDSLKSFVERTICSQVAHSLHRDFASLGLKQSSVDLDRSSVRLYVAGEWNGSCIGDGRVPETKPTSCIFFEPYLTVNKSVSIKCVLQAVNTSKLHDLGISMASGKLSTRYEVEWARIPGNSDVAKTVWLLEKTAGLPDYFARPPVPASIGAAAPES